MAKEYIFNQRVTILRPQNIEDGLGGFKQVLGILGTFWAEAQFKDSKGVELSQYKESIQLIVTLRNTPDTIQIQPDDLVEFRQGKYRIAGRKSDVKTITLTCYEANEP